MRHEKLIYSWRSKKVRICLLKEIKNFSSVLKEGVLNPLLFLIFIVDSISIIEHSITFLYVDLFRISVFVNLVPLMMSLSLYKGVLTTQENG